MTRTITTRIIDEVPNCPVKVDNVVHVHDPSGRGFCCGRVFSRPRLNYVRRGADFVPIVLVPIVFDGGGTALYARLLTCCVRDVAVERVEVIRTPHRS